MCRRQFKHPEPSPINVFQQVTRIEKVKKKILVTCCDEYTKTIVSGSLEDHGFDVATKSSVGEVLPFYKDNGTEFSLVVLDVDMPKGYDILYSMKRAYGGSVILCLCSDCQVKTRAMVISQGACGLISKPVQVPEILGKVDECLVRLE